MPSEETHGDSELATCPNFMRGRVKFRTIITNPDAGTDAGQFEIVAFLYEFEITSVMLAAGHVVTVADPDQNVSASASLLVTGIQ